MAREAGFGKALMMTTTPVVTAGTVPPAAATPIAKVTTAKTKGKHSSLGYLSPHQFELHQTGHAAERK